jgi:hypothetical protein
MTFNNTMLYKWYNEIIDTTQRLHIPQELLNCNTRNIACIMNRQHMFVWLRYANREDFHSRILSFYLDKESFNKEVMLWLGVKCNPRKLGMHYVFLVEMLKKKGK